MAGYICLEHVGKHFQFPLIVFSCRIELSLGHIVPGKGDNNSGFWARAQLINYGFFGVLGEFRLGAIHGFTHLGHYLFDIVGHLKLSGYNNHTLLGCRLDFFQTIQSFQFFFYWADQQASPIFRGNAIMPHHNHHYRESDIGVHLHRHGQS